MKKTWNPQYHLIQKERSGIRGVGRWVDLRKMKDWKNVMGVYVFATKNKIVKYVGYAGSSNLRTEAMSAHKVRKKTKGATKALYIQCTNKKFAKKLENNLKWLYCPINNKDIKVN